MQHETAETINMILMIVATLTFAVILYLMLVV